MPSQKLQHNRFTWINIIHPVPADIDLLRREFPYIHPLNLEDVLSQTERPKIDEDDDYLFVVLQFPVWDRVARISRASEVDFIVGRNFLVTVHDGQLTPMIHMFEKCQHSPVEREKLMGRGANDAFYVIVDQLVDYIFPILDKVDSNIRAIEENIFTAYTQRIVSDIAVVRRDIIALRRIIRHLVPILEQLERTEHPIIREDLEEYFGDTVDHIYRARDIMDEDAEVIAGLADTANTLVSHRINEVMRILTVISVIILPLTLVTGIYGMNINLPLDEHPLAFIVVMGMMLMISILMVIYFIRRKWI
ncbi:MAG: magnesium/cobalt transporter CorA [Chloroflexi bacterium]|nr:magnesium/cobalt transporter CorA [Chloroflexota bacterium]